MGVVLEVTEVNSLKRFRFWGWIVTDVSIIAFLVVLGLSLVFGLGINGISTLPVISLALIGLAVVFIGGLTFEIYGSIRIWLSRRRAARETPVRRRAKRTRVQREDISNSSSNF